MNGQTQNRSFLRYFPNFVSRFVLNANKNERQQSELSVDSVRHVLDCKSKERHLLTFGQSIIFWQQRRIADRIAHRMVAEGHKVASLHGAKEGSERDLNIDGFQGGPGERFHFEIEDGVVPGNRNADELMRSDSGLLLHVIL